MTGSGEDFQNQNDYDKPRSGFDEHTINNNYFMDETTNNQSLVNLENQKKSDLEIEVESVLFANE